MTKPIIRLLCLSIMVIYTSCHSGKEKKEAPAELLVTSPVQSDTTITNEYVCQIHAIRHIEVRNQERGYLQDIYVDEGQFVNKGQLLFRIMPNLYRAEYNKAQAETKVAAIEVKNAQTLADKDIISENELAMAKAKFKKAQAEQALAQTHLSFTEIRAPFSGYVGRFHVRLGSMLEEGELITELSDNSKMWVYFNMPEAAYLDYKMSHSSGLDTVRLLMANNKKFEQEGIIETIMSDFNNETGTIAFRATFPNPDKLLRHGETGNVLVEVPFSNALMIPQKATFEILDKKYVYVVDAKNKVHSRAINIAAEMPDLYIVSDGLKAQDKILLEGLRKVHDDQVIKYHFENPRKVIGQLMLPTK